MSVVVRRATLDDCQAIQAFIARNYGSMAPYKGPHRWQWQFLDNPRRIACGDYVPVWIAEDTATARVVGQIAVQEGRLHIRGAEHNAGWIVDVMVDPDYRGQGLGHRIHSAVAHDMTTLVTLTMAPATRRIADRHGCVTLGSVYQFNRVIRSRPRSVRHYFLFRTQNRPRLGRVARLCCDRLGLHYPVSLLVNVLSKTILRIGSARSGRAAIRVDEVDRYAAEDDVFFATAMASYPACFERSAGVWNWRFCDTPDLDYRRFRAMNGDRVVGQLVLRHCTNEELPIGTIVELLTENGDWRTAAVLLRFACRHFGNGVEALDAAASTPDLIRLYRRFGFVPTRRMRPTVVCSDTALASDIESEKNEWFFSKADHDWDQIHVVDSPRHTPEPRR